MDSRDYKTIAKWLERIGLVLVSSLAAHRIFAESGPRFDGAVLWGMALSVLVYALAVGFLIKS